MSEDQEWSRRVLLAGFSIVYEPRAVVHHSHAYSIAGAFRRFFDSGVSAERSYVGETPEARAVMRRASVATREARSRGCGVPASGAGSRTPPSTSSAKFTGLQLGRRHERLPVVV